jgi:hypothetical protein
LKMPTTSRMDVRKGIATERGSSQQVT